MSAVERGSRILKVDHAGEFGAICIYTGQIAMARLTARSLVGELRGFREHERGHRRIFQAELERRGVRRCRSYWLCGTGGLVLGIVTGLFGRAAISATTVAVEAVVLRHLEHQLSELVASDPAAALAIGTIVDEERLHHDTASSHVPAGGFWHRVLTPLVSASTEAVIWLGMRL